MSYYLELQFCPTYKQLLDEAIKFLKSLNQLTGDMMEFMKRHNLRSPIEVM
jgi:hypothetical protein